MPRTAAKSDTAKSNTATQASFAARLNAAASETEHLLDRLLGKTLAEGEIARPPRVTEAMRYSSLGGGKRLRPFLTVETAALFGVRREHALMAGAAIELVHCYSLVHDDLPAMDDDDLRRGRPTAHKKFDEATAILAGDGLLTFAFDVLGRPETHPDANVRIALVTGLARAAGLGGMVGGQMLDLAAEGRFGKRRHAAGREGRADAAGDEDRRDPEVLLRRRRNPRQRAEGQARGGEPLRPGDRPGVPDRRRPARRRRRHGDTRQGRRARTPPTARRRWSICSALPARARASSSW